MRKGDARHDAEGVLRSNDRVALGNLRLRQRPSLSLGLGVSVLAVLAAGLAAIAALIGERSGLTDPVPLRPVSDPRILSNLRAPEHAAPFVDMAIDDLRRELMLARADGTVHVLDLDTRLLHEEGLSAGIGAGIVELSGGCGTTGGAREIPDCPHAASIFARSASGGLAERRGGVWRTLVSDSAWIGLDGEPVRETDLAAWTVSASGRWLLAIAGAKGVGLFDTVAATWVDLPAEVRTTIAKSKDHQLVALGEAFWIAGSKGISRLDPGAISIALTPVEAFADARIRALTRTPENTLLAIAETPCPGGACLSLNLIDAVGETTRLLGEREFHSVLTTGRIWHAALQDERVVTLGQDGVFAYDPLQRAWMNLAEGPVEAHHTSPDGWLTVALPGRVLTIAGAEVQTTDAHGMGAIRQIEPGADGRLFALTERGAIIELGTFSVVFDPLPPEFSPGGTSTAASLGDLMLMLGPDGALFHNVAERWYASLPAERLPTELLSDDVRLFAGGGAFWAAAEEEGSVWPIVHAIERSDARLSLGRPAALPPPLRDIQSHPGGLSVVDGEGRIYRLSTAGNLTRAEPLIGRTRGPDQPLASVHGVAGGLAASTGRDLWTYDIEARAWEQRRLSLPDGASVRQLAAAPAALAGEELIVDDLRRLFAVNGGRLLELLGGPPAPFGSAELTDALSHNGALYLAGQGSVARYDPARRRFDAVWSGGRDPVELSGVLDGRPVWISGGALYHGNDELTSRGSTAERAWLEASAIVALIRRDGVRFLARLPLGRGDSVPECFFAQPEPANRTLVDARALADGRLAVQTQRGLSFYDSPKRRWIDTTDTEPVASDRLRLFNLDGTLVRTRPGRVDLLQPPPPANSCESGPQAVSWTRHQAASFAVDERSGQVATLAGTGAVRLFRGASPEDGFVEVLPPAEAAPDPKTFRRVHKVGETLLFTGAVALWRYDLSRRLWGEVALTPDAQSVEAVDLRPDGPDSAAITVWAGGRAYGGYWRATSPDAVDLSPEPEPALTAFPHDPAALVDVAQLSASQWLFLFEDRLAAMDPATGRWSAAVLLEEARRDRRLQIWHDTPVLSEGGTGAPTRHWFLLDEMPAADLPLADMAFAYSPGDDRSAAWNSDAREMFRIASDGALLVCAARAGAGTELCETRSPPPLKLQPDAVRAAHVLGGSVVLQMADGWRFLSGDRREMLPLGLPDPTSLEPDLVLRASDGLHFWTRSGPLVRVGADGRVSTRAQSVDQIRADASGRIWIARGAEITPLDLATASDLPVRGFSNAGDPLMVDPAGKVVVSADPGGDPWPGLIAPEGVLGIVPGAIARPDRSLAQGLWMQEATGLTRFVALLPCEPDGPSFAGGPRCQRVLAEVPAPAAEQRIPILRAARTTSDGIALDFDGSRIDLDPGGRVRGTSPIGPAWPLPTPAEDLRERIVSEIEIVGGDPVLLPSKIVGRAGRIMVQAGQERDLSRGAVTPQALPAAKLDWLAWSRATGRFRVGLGQQAVAIAPEGLITSDRFAWSEVGAAIFSGRDGWVRATGSGYWWIDDAGRVVGAQPRSLPPATGMLRGAFLFGDGQSAAPGNAPSDLPASPDLTIGDLKLREERGGISAQAMVSGVSRDAWSERGFLFDRREAVGWTQGRLVIVTPFGVLEPDQLDRIDALPEGGLDDIASVDGVLYARAGGRYLRLEDGAWQPTEDPLASWDMVTEGMWRWRSVNGVREIALAAPDGTQLAEFARLGFASDRLLAVAGGGQHVAILTEAGVSSADALAPLLSSRVSDNVPWQARDLDVRQLLPDSKTVVARSDDGQFVRGTERWERMAPEVERQDEVLLHSDPVLEVRLRNGRPVVAARVLGPDGLPAEIPMTWQSGERMPIDEAQSVVSEEDRILVGTRLGIRVLSWSGSGRAENVTLFALGGTSEVAPRLGRPKEAPDRIIAQTETACLDLTNETPQPCAQDRYSGRHLLAEGAFWRWTDGPRGLRGVYLDQLGEPIGPDIELSTPVLPHDRILRAVSCGGLRAELWESGDILAEREGGRVRLIAAPDTGISELVCVDIGLPLGDGDSLEPGLYAVGADAHRLADDWQSVSPAKALALQTRDRYPFYRSRMRQVLDPRGARFEFRTAEDAWVSLSGNEGLSALDETRAIIGHEGTLWRLTGSGFVPLWLSVDRLQIDPDLVLLQPDRDLLESCAFDRISAASDLRADRAWLRCRDGRVFAGLLDVGTGAGGFTLREEDPFVSQNLIGSGDPWEWRRVETLPGSAGRLEVRLDGSVLGLSGRFSSDDLRGAVATGPRLDLTAADGWWQAERAAPGLTGLRRKRLPGVSPEEVTSLDPATDGALCLHAGEERIILSPEGRATSVAACETRLGTDGLWAYTSREGAPVATATTRNGVVQTRQLVDGRFSDLVLTGPPVPDWQGPGTLIAPTGAGLAVLSPGNGVVGLVSAAPGTRLAPDPEGNNWRATAADTALCPGQSPAPASSVLRTAGGLELTSTRPDGRTRVLITCQRDSAPLPWAARLEVRDRIRFDALSTRHDLAGDLLVRASERDLSTANGTQRRAFALPGPPLRVLADERGGQVFVLTPDDLFVLDGDAALSHLYARGAGQ